MRVLQIIPAISPIYGGPSQMVTGFSKALAGAGVAVTILTTDANGDTGQAPLTVPLYQPVQQDGYEIRYFRQTGRQRYKFSVGLLRWLSLHAPEFDLAHIHALFSPVSSAAAAIARTRRLPYILRPLGTLDPIDLKKKRRLKQLYAALLERPNLAGAAAVHFTSHQEAETAERFGLSLRDWVLPLGVDQSDFAVAPAARQAIAQATRDRLGIPPDRPVVLFLSRLDPKKGLDLLIPALEQVQQAGILFHWILAGSNPQDPAYENQVRDRLQGSPLSACSTQTGFVAGQPKRDLLLLADLFVLPSYYENFGIAVAEAMAAGVPVVVSNQVPLHQDIAQAQAGWVVPCRSDALADTLAIALQSVHRPQRGEAAQRWARQHYTWEAIAQRTVQHYEIILQDTHRQSA
ncbi:MAG: glycosyltransferase [Cyanobacteria bacterium J069]|nr:MAG: glycosyltransferase [Cyanobacteria bacterium J069]